MRTLGFIKDSKKENQPLTSPHLRKVRFCIFFYRVPVYTVFCTKCHLQLNRSLGTANVLVIYRYPRQIFGCQYNWWHSIPHTYSSQAMSLVYIINQNTKCDSLDTLLSVSKLALQFYCEYFKQSKIHSVTNLIALKS